MRASTLGRLLLLTVLAMGLTGFVVSGADAQEKKSGLRDLVYEEDDSPALSAGELEALRQKAQAQYENENMAEAIALFKQYLAGAGSGLGQDHPRVAGAWLYLGYCYSDSGQAAEAVEPLRRGLEILTKKKGPEGLETAQLVAPLVLAGALNATEEYAEAVAVMNEYLPLMQKKLGRNSSLVAAGLEIMAESCTGLGLTEEAQDFAKMAAELKAGQKKQSAKKGQSGGKKSGQPAYQQVPGFTKTYEKIQALRKAGQNAEALKLAAALDGKISALKNPDPDQQLWGKKLQQYITRDMGRLRESLTLAETVLELEIRAGGQDSPDALLARRNLGSAHSRLGNNQKAYELQKYVYDAYLRDKGPGDSATVSMGLNLVNELTYLNRYGDALKLAAQLAESSRRDLGPKHEQTFRAVNSWANTLSVIGDYDQAAEIAAANRAAARQALGQDHAATIRSLEILMVIQGNNPDGDKSELLQYAREHFEYQLRINGPEHPSTLHSEQNYLLALSENKQFDQAGKGLESALPRLAKVYGEDHQVYLLALKNWGDFNRETGEVDKSIEILEELLPRVKASGDEELYFHAAYSLTQSLRAKGDLGSAAFFGRQAVEAGQSLRRSLAGGSQEAQKSLAKLMTPAYQELADVLMAQNKVSEAQKVMELLKAAELADMAIGAPAAASSSPAAQPGDGKSQALLAGVDPDIARRYQEISGQLAALGEEQRALLEKRKSGDTLSAKEEARLKELRQDMTAARKVFSSFVANLSEEMAESGNRQAADLGNLETYQRLLGTMGEGTVLIQTILTDNRLWLILTTPNAMVAKESPLNVGTLSDKVAKFRDALQDPDDDARPLAKEFYEDLIGPLAEALTQAGAKTIMFSLDGQLRYIPMATLYDGKKWLIQNYRVALFNDATKAGLAVPFVGNWQVAGLGVTKGHAVDVGGKRGNFSALPAVKDELEAIVKTKNNKDGVLQGSMTLDEGFTSERLAEVLEAGYPVVHLASHFHFDSRNPEKSFLLLGDGSGLPLTQIETADYKFKNVDLLALSACQTARGGVDATGKEIEGFGALAQKRGAKAVLATLWPVFDESTGLLMSSFYRLHNDKNKPSIAESLRKAQLMMIDNQIKGKDFQHPFYWGPFVLMGDWR